MSLQPPLVVAGNQVQRMQPGDQIDPRFYAPGSSIGFSVTGLEQQSVVGNNANITIQPGQALDSMQAVMMTLTAPILVSVGSLDVPLGLVRAALTGTVSVNSTSTSVVGTGTHFLTMIPPIALTGTVTVAGTAITGTGTKFTTQLKPRDLIGNPTYGYAYVLSVESDTAATLAVASPGGNYSGQTVNRLEISGFYANTSGQVGHNIYTITDDTHLSLVVNSDATASGVSAFVGHYVQGTGSTQAFYLFLIAKTDGTTSVIMSAQRTVPILPAGYVYYRRIGSFQWDGNVGTIIPYTQRGSGLDRWYTYQIVAGAHSTTILSGGGATAWTPINASTLVPQTADSLLLNINVSGPSAAVGVYVSPRNTGETATSRPLWVYGNPSLYNSGNYWCDTDSSQQIQYVLSGGAGSPAYIYLGGYHENLDAPNISASGMTTGGGSPSGYLAGLRMAYTGAFTLTVSPGQARDSTSSIDLVLPNLATVNVSNPSVPLGLDMKAIAGTVSTSASTSNVTGTGTSFLTAFGTRTCSGTITGGGTGSTTITGTGTKFLSEFAYGDLIGTPTAGYTQITQILSDTSLTLASNLPNGDAGGAAPVCIEQPTLQPGGSATVRMVVNIANNTLLATNGTDGTAYTNVTGYIGNFQRNQNSYLMLFLTTGPLGTTVIASTQRTTPYGVSGYNTNWRRIGSIIMDPTIPGMLPFSQFNYSQTTRMTVFEVASSSHNTRILSSGGATTWSSFGATLVAPPTAIALGVTAMVYFPTANCNLCFRRRNIGETTTARDMYVYGVSGQVATNSLLLPCDGAQYCDYVLSNAAGSPAYCDMWGYLDDLSGGVPGGGGAGGGQVMSVFGRTGNVVAVNGDYNASQVTNAFDVTVADTLTQVAAPAAATPAGKVSVWADSTNGVLSSRNPAGQVSNTVVPSTHPANTFAVGIGPNGVITYAQPSMANVGSLAACLYNAGDQGISSGGWGGLVLGSALYDTGGFTGHIANAHSIPVTGKYLCNLSIQWGSGWSGMWGARFIVNGTAYWGLTLLPSNSAGTTNATVTAQIPLNSGDNIQVQVYQNSGSPINISYAPSYSPFFSIALLGAP